MSDTNAGPYRVVQTGATFYLTSADVLREVREAMTEILPMAERGRSRGIYCGTECLGTCDECKAIVRYNAALAKLPKTEAP